MKAQLTPGDGDPRHGHGGYSNLGCRCDICRAAIAAYRREIRATNARRLAEGRVDPPHGVNSTYVEYRCRCSECRRAANDLQRARKASR